MKKLLGIVVLGLLVCSAVYAKPKPKKIVYESYSAVSFNEIFNSPHNSCVSRSVKVSKGEPLIT